MNQSGNFKPIKPILKWVGGKTQILSKILDEFPKEINNYHELFLGGGSVLLGLLSLINNNTIRLTGKIYVYDINEPLIYVYKNIQRTPDEIYNELTVIITEYNNCEEDEKTQVIRKPRTLEEAKLSKENYYYWSRQKYNNLSSDEKKDVIGSALFIFLNKTCFRGVFRLGPNGFNVPYGNYKNPEIVNREHLTIIHNLIQPVIFNYSDFRNSFQEILSGRFSEKDYIYLDPPYAPETSTSFVNYTENGFDISFHKDLFKFIHICTDKNIRLMMSNADVNLIRENFPENKYLINSIICKRYINSKKPNFKTREVIIKNYINLGFEKNKIRIFSRIMDT